MKNGFFDSVSGNKSSSRLVGFIVILFSLLFVQEILFFSSKDIIAASIAAGTMFMTIAGPAMLFMFGNKREEIKHEETKITTNE